MKTIGSLLLIFAGLNFLVTIYAACIGEFYEAGNKLSSTIIVGLIGGILYHFSAKIQRELLMPGEGPQTSVRANLSGGQILK